MPLTKICLNFRVIKKTLISNLEDDALGPDRAAPLTGYHEISGKDKTWSFARKGIKLVEKQSRKQVPNLQKAFLVHFVCQLYVCNTQNAKLNDARWGLLRKHPDPL